MSDSVNRSRLTVLAETAQQSIDDGGKYPTLSSPEISAFRAACSPDVVLALLAELAEKDERLAATSATLNQLSGMCDERGRYAANQNHRAIAAEVRASTAEAALERVRSLADPRSASERRDPTTALGRTHTVREVLAAAALVVGDETKRLTCSCCEATDGVEHEGVIGAAVDPISMLCLHCQPCPRCNRMGTGCDDRPNGRCDPVAAGVVGEPEQPRRLCVVDVESGGFCDENYGGCCQSAAETPDEQR